MKTRINLYLLCMLCVAQAPIQADNIFSKTWNKAKQTAQSTYNKAQKGWNELNENTKDAAIVGSSIGGFGTMAGTMTTIGKSTAKTGYYKMYTPKKQPQEKMLARPRPSIFSEEQ